MLIKDDYMQIVCTETSDIPFVVEAEQNNENSNYVGQWTYEQHLDSLNDPDILHLIIKKLDGRNVGYAIIRGTTNPNHSLEMMRIVVAEKGCGYGKHFLLLMIKWCFEFQNTHRLWLDVREHNVRAQHVYETVGFIREGLLRECIKNGDTYQSLVVMSILRQDYTAIKIKF